MKNFSFAIKASNHINDVKDTITEVIVRATTLVEACEVVARDCYREGYRTVTIWNFVLTGETPFYWQHSPIMVRSLRTW